MNIDPLATPRDRWRWLRTRTSAVVGAAIAAILLASSAWLLAAEFDRSELLQAEVHQSYERRAELQSILSLHQDIETGQRGYVLTGDTTFLEPYFRARSRLQAEMPGLAQAQDSAHLLGPQLARLRRLSAEKLAFADRAIALQMRGEGRKAADMVTEGQGKRVMDQIREVIAAADRTELHLLERRLDQSRRAARSAQRMSVAVQIVLILLLAMAARIVERSLSKRRRAQTALEAANIRQAAIFNSARDGIIVLNASGSIESLNPSAARMFGYSPDALVRRDVGLLFEVAPDQGLIETFLKRLRRRGAAENAATHEYWGQRQDGTTFPVDVALSTVSLNGGPRYVAIVRDISERKQVDRMKTEFVSTVSHELRTPLTSIAGSLGLLAGGVAGEIPGPAARLIEVARSNCERLIRLINDMLDVEKIESGELRFDIKPVQLSDLLRQTVEANRGFALTHQVKLVLMAVPTKAWAMADPDALAQVITNLLSNAVKFSPPGKAVRIDVRRLDRRWRISVSDRGSGIPEEFRGRIFGKFAQADSTDARRRGGTGLGLSIVREIVTRFGGAVDFEDREGGGTSFHADIPAAEPMTGYFKNQDDEKAHFPFILQVEDDPDVVRLTSQAFAGRATVRNVTTLAAARALLASRGFDALILDLTLPDGSGLELLAEVKALPGGPPVLIFSAEEPAPASAAADAVLTKSSASLERLVVTTLDIVARRPRRS